MNVDSVRDQARGEEHAVTFEAARPAEVRMHERDAHSA
jgi:hypothetical protein